MQRTLIVLAAIVVCALGAALPVAAQDTQPVDVVAVNPNANISFPPPVYVVRGEVQIRGSANLPNMANYFVEYRPLDESEFTQQEQAAAVPSIAPTESSEASLQTDDALQGVTGGWIPALLPSSTAVQDDVLGVWNTTITPDGLYQIRLHINLTTGEAVFYNVGPLRVENNPPPFVDVAPVQQPAQPEQPSDVVLPTIPPLPTQPQAQPAQQATAVPPTATPDSTPRATATVSANVREGDSTEYPVVGFLQNGSTARIIGVSNRGTGWYLIQLDTGARGWISPSVVDTSGDLTNLQRIQPPPVPATPTPTPVPATATPTTRPNMIIEDIDLDPSTPVCDNTFTVDIRVRNIGDGATGRSGAISVQDFYVDEDQLAASTVGAFPNLGPGEATTASVRLTVDDGPDERHRIVIVVDSNSEIGESNESDNFASRDYTLALGSCDVSDDDDDDVPEDDDTCIEDSDEDDDNVCDEFE